jgi:hypothetical protein
VSTLGFSRVLFVSNKLVLDKIAILFEIIIIVYTSTPAEINRLLNRR